MRSLVNSTVQDVCTKTQISYKTIVSALDRSVHKTVDWDLYQSLATLGIDDISIKKGHQDFVTVVSTKQDEGGVSVLSVFEGRDKADVISFLNSIPLHLRKTVTTVCTDMYEGYANAAVEVFGKQSIVIDRYHVAKQYRKPLDALRISELKRLKSLLSQDDYSKLEGVMWILRKKHECLSTEDKDKLQLLYEYSPELKEAHKMAMKLTNIFNTHQNRKSGIKKLNGWILAVQKSEVTCFNRFIATLERHKSGIANYFKNRKNSGFVEGLNNKIKLTKRRCYGFFKVESLFKRLQLDCNGFKIFAL
jgi:transposase